MARCRSRSADSPSFLMRSLSSSISCSGPSCASAGESKSRLPQAASVAARMEWSVLISALVFQQHRRIDQQVQTLGCAMGLNGEDVHAVLQAARQIFE